MATTIRNSNLFCTCCGGVFVLTYPAEVDDYSKKLKHFNALHKDCKQTWVEPVADQSKDVNEKALWWFSNGEKGMSSETMYNCLIGNTYFKINHPYDPDDFSRCYKLLETVPEWKLELHKLKPLSKEWNNLIENWDKLTKMYELNVKENWKNSEEIGMYKFMQNLIR